MTCKSRVNLRPQASRKETLQEWTLSGQIGMMVSTNIGPLSTYCGTVFYLTAQHQILSGHESTDC